MPHHSDVHRRRSIRLPDYDYSTIGAYFVTICTFQRECLFGEVVDGAMRLNGAGEMMQQAWDALANHFRHVELDQFVIMPNHVLGIIVLTDGGRGDEGGVGAKQGSSASPGSASSDFDTNGSDVCIIQGKAGKTFALPLHGTLPLRGTMHGTIPGSLCAVVQNFKSVTTRKINQFRHTPAHPVWQRNYYEHVIRDDRDLAAIRADTSLATRPNGWRTKIIPCP